MGEEDNTEVILWARCGGGVVEEDNTELSDTVGAVWGRKKNGIEMEWKKWRDVFSLESDSLRNGNYITFIKIQQHSSNTHPAQHSNITLRTALQHHTCSPAQQQHNFSLALQNHTSSPVLQHHTSSPALQSHFEQHSLQQHTSSQALHTPLLAQHSNITFPAKHSRNSLLT